MGVSITANSQNFTDEVLQPSYEKPVLVDFFAQWCGPCQMLKPVLEKLAQEYDFILAKVDIDENPDLANTYGVQGVPDVRIVMQGQVKPGFVGMLPEPRLRQMLDQLNLQSQLQSGLQAFRVALAAGETEEAQTLMAALLEHYPTDRPLLLEAAQFLLRLGEIDVADQLLSQVQEHEKAYYAQAQALKTLVQFQRDLATPQAESPLDEQFLQAERLTLEGNYEAALEAFLAIVSRDRKYRNDGARKAMVSLFDLLGSDHALTKDYRRKLMSALY